MGNPEVNPREVDDRPKGVDGGPRGADGVPWGPGVGPKGVVENIDWLPE